MAERRRSDRERDLLWSLGLVAVVVIACTAGYIDDPFFFWHDDNETQHLAGCLEVGKLYLSGNVPLLTMTSWYASSIGPEYQYAIFQPWVVLSDVIAAALALPLQASAALLAMLQLIVAAVGGYLLGRSYRLVRPLAAVVAIAATFNGWQIQWGATNWFPALSSSVWLPWAWWALRVALREKPPRWAPLMVAVTMTMVVNAGWPYSDLALVLIVILNALTLRPRTWRRAIPAFVGLLAGTAFSIPAILLLLSMLPEAERLIGSTGLHWWVVPPSSLIGVIFPGQYTHWSMWGTVRVRTNLDYAAAFVPAAGLFAVILFSRRRFVRRYWPEILVLAASTILMMLPGAGPFRFSFRWLPLWHLLLAIVGICGLQTVLRRRGWTLPLLAMAFICFLLGLHAASGFKGMGIYGAGMLVLSFATAALEVKWRKFAVSMLVVVALFNSTSFYKLIYHDEDVPLWNFGDYLQDMAPFSPDKTYFSTFTSPEVFARNRMVDERLPSSTLFRPGNTMFYSGVRFINGYTAMFPRSLHRLLGLGHLGEVEIDLNALLARESGPDGLLGHYGVDGIVGFRGTMLPLTRDGQWRVVAEEGPDVLIERVKPIGAPARAAAQIVHLPNDDAVTHAIMRRKQPRMPVIVTGDSPREVCRTVRIESAENEPNVSRAVIDASGCDAPSLIVFSRIWQNGFQARFEGKTAQLVKVDATMPGVVVPPHSRGTVVLRYWPRELTIGIVIALAGALLLAGYSISFTRR